MRMLLVYFLGVASLPLHAFQGPLPTDGARGRQQAGSARPHQDEPTDEREPEFPRRLRLVIDQDRPFRGPLTAVANAGLADRQVSIASDLVPEAGAHVDRTEMMDHSLRILP